MLCRVVAYKLRGTFGKAIAVENRSGEAGSIGASAAAAAQPDGYTLLCTPHAPIVLSPSSINMLYSGSAPSQRALVGGEVDVLIDSLPALLPGLPA